MIRNQSDNIVESPRRHFPVSLYLHRLVSEFHDDCQSLELLSCQLVTWLELSTTSTSRDFS
jgi:hypothetical protein